MCKMHSFISTNNRNKSDCEESKDAPVKKRSRRQSDRKHTEEIGDRSEKSVGFEGKDPRRTGSIDGNIQYLLANTN